MDEQALRGLLNEVKAGRLSRRAFVQTMVGLGLTAPLAGQMLASAGVAQAQPKLAGPAKRGGGGMLKVLWWQAPTLLNPHFAVGTKDQDGSRIFYEPLAAFDPDGNIIPVLAAELPTPQNGGLSKDGKSVTWRLKKNVQWHEVPRGAGQPEAGRHGSLPLRRLQARRRGARRAESQLPPSERSLLRPVRDEGRR
jgi:peptide/nickel transport system substrate-binding protein